MTREWSDLIIYVGAVVGLLIIIGWIIRVCVALMMYCIDKVQGE